MRVRSPARDGCGAAECTALVSSGTAAASSRIAVPGGRSSADELAWSSSVGLGIGRGCRDGGVHVACELHKFQQALLGIYAK